MSSASSNESWGGSLAPKLAQTSSRDSDLRVAVIEDIVGFAAMREEWNDLLAASSSNCLFLSWEWLYTWWTHLGQGKRLFIVTVRSERQLVAIAPLTLTRASAGPVPVPVLEFAGTGSIGSDYLDFIVRSASQTAALGALTAFLADTGFRIRMPSVKEGSAVTTALCRELADRGWEHVQIPMGVCPFIDLSGGSWDSYLNGLRRKHRSNFRRSLRNLDRDYAVAFQYADSEPERRKALRHLVSLHLMRWRTQGGSTAFYNANLLAFHEEFSRLALERGWLRLLVLTLDGVEAASFYGFRYGRAYHFYQSGLDPAFSRYSVGLVTVGLTIRDAFNEGAAEYDFLHGEEAYKYLWATQVRRLVRFELYPPGRMGHTRRNAARVVAATKKLAKRILQKGMARATPPLPVDIE